MGAGARSECDSLPSLLVFIKILKLLTSKVTGKHPAVTCLVLKEEKRANQIAGFFGASLRGLEGAKTELTQFRHNKLREGYHPMTLEKKNGVNLDYDCCAETIPMLCNLSV